MTFQMAFKVPKWLYNIPKGKYTIAELVSLTKVSAANIYMRFDILKVEKVYSRENIAWKNIYNWKGALYYIKKSHKLEIEIFEAEQKKLEWW